MTELEAAWLDYSWEVITSDHVETCVRSGGIGIDNQKLRWPGYMGDGYTEGGLLFVGNIHRDFDSGKVKSGLAEKLSNGSIAWVNKGRSEESDNSYMQNNRSCYLEGFAGWRIGAFFKKLLTQVDMEWNEVAYTNGAKCQSLNGSEQKLQMLCQQAFPVKNLIRFLKPSVIVTCSQPIRDQLGGNADVFWFNSRNGLNEKRESFDVWAPRVVDLFNKERLF